MPVLQVQIMIVIPAIDMLDHRAVRLKQGKREDVTVYGENILDMAERWIDEGASRLHLVDLNGAFDGKPFHMKDVQAIAKKYPKLQTEIGGGIRALETLKIYFDSGISFVILGTVAVKNPQFLEEACKIFPGKIILGVDAKNGHVATEGWDKTSASTAFDLVKKFSHLPIESLIYTDISKDGMLSGMNLEQIKFMKDAGIPLIASGGLTELSDIDSLKSMGGIKGVIAGKAIYEGKFSLHEAVSRAS